MKNTVKKPFFKKPVSNEKDTKANPFLEMIVSGIENITDETWEFYLKAKVDFEPKNLFSNKPYVRFNRMALIIDMMKNNFLKNQYATFNQISQAGGKIIKGAKSVVLQYFNYDVKHNETKTRITFREFLKLSESEKASYTVKSYVKYFRVFNISFIENVEEMNLDTVMIDEAEELEDINHSFEADLFIQKLKDQKQLVLEHKLSNVAFYTPSTDIVTMPNTEYFKSDVAYYSTLFHELIHWTGHSTRLDRFDTKNVQDKEAYAYEELIAEMGSMLVYFDYNFQEEFINSLVYLKSWLKATDKNKDRNDVLADAFKASNKAVNFLYK